MEASASSHALSNSALQEILFASDASDSSNDSLTNILQFLCDSNSSHSSTENELMTSSEVMNVTGADDQLSISFADDQLSISFDPVDSSTSNAAMLKQRLRGLRRVNTSLIEGHGPDRDDLDAMHMFDVMREDDMLQLQRELVVSDETGSGDDMRFADATDGDVEVNAVDGMIPNEDDMHVIVPAPQDVEDIDDQLITYEISKGSAKYGGDILKDSKDYEYSITSGKRKLIIWSCVYKSSQKCSGRYLPGRAIERYEHDCTPIIAPEKRRKVVLDAKKKGVARPDDTCKKIAEESIRANYSPSERLLENNGVPTTRQLCDRLSYERNKNLAPEPKDLNFDLNAHSIPDTFLQKDIHDVRSRHLIFATENMLKYLKDAKTWYVDGTFKVIRHPFKQLFSVHVFVKHGDYTKQVPVAFVMMSSRTKEDYESVFEALLALVPECQVSSVVADFEGATWTALRGMMARGTFPQVVLKGCMFHFTQAVYRRIVKEKLKSAYNKKAGTQHLCRKLMTLPLVPCQSIPNVFEDLEAEIIQTGNQKLINVAIYMRNNWIDGRLFNPVDWCWFDMFTRTNNDLEGYHHRLNKRCVRQHLKFIQLVNKLKEEADQMAHDVIGVFVGVVTVNHSRATQDRNAKLSTLWGLFKAGQITAKVLLEDASWHTTPSANMLQFLADPDVPVAE